MQRAEPCEQPRRWSARAELKEVVGQKRLADKVSGILERIEKELDSVEISIGESMHVLDTDNDGMVRLLSILCTLCCGMAQTNMPDASPWLLRAGDPGGADDGDGLPARAAGRGRAARAARPP